MAGSEVVRSAIVHLVWDPDWDPTEPEGPCLRCLHHLHQVRHLVHLVLQVHLVADVVVCSQRSRRPLKVWGMVSLAKVLLVKVLLM